MGTSHEADRRAFAQAPPERKFSVVDVETTGFNSRGSDRIVEVAIVTTDALGRVHDEFTTLVDPERDVGSTRIHGITASDLIGAPTFREIAGAVAERLEGTIVVAHNVIFDEGFLRSEFARIGHLLPRFPTLCTLHLVSLLAIDAPTRQLADCCDALGVERGEAHAALPDARAAAGLLAACLKIAREDGLEIPADSARPLEQDRSAWPRLPHSTRTLGRRARIDQPPVVVPFLARVVAALPHDSTIPPNGTAYLGALDLALEDRIVTEAEAEHLRDVATACHLTRADAARLHLDYFTSMVRVAFAEGHLSELERGDLVTVGRVIGLGPIVIESQLANDSSIRPDGAARPPVDTSAPAGSLRGKSVCFTGEFAASVNRRVPSREEVERIAKASGLKVVKSVSKKLEFLVAADPNTKSGKARTAREYGIPIMGEREFWSAIGVVVD